LEFVAVFRLISRDNSMPSSDALDTPIALKDGRAIATLNDVRALITALPFAHQMRPYWQRTHDLLHDAGRRKGRPSDATITQLRKALTAQGLL
jgi:hypothetical protein